jgi:hypothetical protein
MYSFVPVILSLASRYDLLCLNGGPAQGMRRCGCNTLAVLPMGQGSDLCAFGGEGYKRQDIIWDYKIRQNEMGLFRYFMDELY